MYDVIAAYHTPSGGAVTTPPARLRLRGVPARVRCDRGGRCPGCRSPARRWPRARRPARDRGSTRCRASCAAEPRVRTLTVHRYPLRNCFVGPGSPQYPTVAHLLAELRDDRPGRQRAALGARSRTPSGRQLRVDELNSVACRGKAGVSDTFASRAVGARRAVLARARRASTGSTCTRSRARPTSCSSSAAPTGAGAPRCRPSTTGCELFAQAAPPGSRLLEDRRRRARAAAQRVGHPSARRPGAGGADQQEPARRRRSSACARRPARPGRRPC